MKNTNKPRKVKTIHDILYNLNLHANELKKTLEEQKKWEKLIKKNSNERTYI